MKKARENFEYRCAQPSRDIKDFIEYIKYERIIIGLTKQRTKLHKLTQNHTIGALIANRMKQLYDQSLSKFPNNLRFWDEYIKFLQQFKYTKDIPSTFDRMLRVRPSKSAKDTNRSINSMPHLLKLLLYSRFSFIVIRLMFGFGQSYGNTIKTFAMNG